MLNSFRTKPAALAGLLCAAASASAATPITIALSGAAAPGGGTYSAFTNPVLNANGEVAFAASITGGTSTSGIFTGTSAATQAIALQGTAAPAGGTFGTLYSATTTTSTTLNSSGLLAFQAPLSGTSTNGIFVGTSAATLQTIAVNSTPTPAGGTYNAFLANGTNTAYSPLINNAGTVAFQSSITGGTATPAIFDGTPGALQTVAIVGGAAPGGASYAATVTVPTLNANGQVAFVSQVSGNYGFFAGAPGAAQALAVQNTAAPGANGEVYSGAPTTTYSYNNANQLAFIYALTGGASGQPTAGVFAGAPGAVQNIALGYSSGLGAGTAGSVAPGGTGGTFTTFGNTTINGRGQVAFTGALTGGTSTGGLFLGSSSSNLQAVALVNGTSPDGETYSSLPGPLFTNSSGEVAFLANLSGADVVSGTNSLELDGGLPGNLVEVVREGDIVDGMTVNGITLLTGSGGQDGKGVTFSDSDEIAYRLTFTGGASGVFESFVPEPTSIGLIVAGTGLLLRRSRRRAGGDC